MIEAFEQFKDSDTMIEDVPQRWSYEHLLYQLCGGDGSKIELFRDWTYPQAVKWFLYKVYDNYVQREMLKKVSDK